jgi:inorganic pyrophosphatase
MAGDQKIRALIEIPKGSRNKYEFRPPIAA